ncbi:MAG: porphobilinogen synthase, partial [Bacteroidia bacterium]|nr:porphobilinogen synthase [Bacteroidia bacterium]
MSLFEIHPLSSRPRRNRKSFAIRELVREHTVEPRQLILPIFVLPDTTAEIPISSMPGISRLGLEETLKQVESALAHQIYNVILFPCVPESLKDQTASYSWVSDNFYLTTIQKIKQTFPEVCVITDVAMDPYSSDGHDGYVENGEIVNDKTLSILARMGLAQAEAGADILGPSDMMDGRIGYLRNMLDKHGYQKTSILSYTAKYASSFYGPFRDALDSAPKSGDKKTYQMSFTNHTEAIREMELDL